MKPGWLRLAVFIGSFMLLVLVTNVLILTLVLRSTENTTTLVDDSKAGSAQAEKIIVHIEDQLNSIISRSDSNRQLICGIAAAVHITSSVIQADCSATNVVGT